MSLIIKELSKSFEDKIIFKNFSYTFPDVGIFSITGKSGIGKTTLLRIIAGLDTKYQGRITGAGFKNVSYAFQEYRLFPNLTAIQNAAVANGASADRARELLFMLGFREDEFNLYPDQLSGGMKQRVSLARALLKEAPVLLLDEPHKELNSELCAKVTGIIKSEGEKRLVIFTTHDEEAIKNASATEINLSLL